MKAAAALFCMTLLVCPGIHDVAQAQIASMEQVRQAERFVRAALGEDCEMNGRSDIPLNDPQPETVSHFAFDIRYRASYQSAEESEKRMTLFQMFCGMGAYNLQHAFVTRDAETGQMRFVAFVRPRLAYDYADEAQTVLNAPPRVIGYVASAVLINARFDPATSTIGSHAFWRGIGDAWDSGAWILSDGEFMLSRYEVDPTYDGAINSDKQESYTVYPPR